MNEVEYGQVTAGADYPEGYTFGGAGIGLHVTAEEVRRALAQPLPAFPDSEHRVLTVTPYGSIKLKLTLEQEADLRALSAAGGVPA